MDVIDLVAEAQHKAMKDIQFKEDMVFLKHMWMTQVVERVKAGEMNSDDTHSLYIFILKYGWHVDDWSSG